MVDTTLDPDDGMGSAVQEHGTQGMHASTQNGTTTTQRRRGSATEINVLSSLEKESCARTVLLEDRMNTLVSYMETKRYLLGMGLETEIKFAPTKFHLKEYAERAGVSLKPLLSRNVKTKQNARQAEEEAVLATATASAAKQVEVAAQALATAAAAEADARRATAAASAAYAEALAKLEEMAREATGAAQCRLLQEQDAANAVPEVDAEAKQQAEEATLRAAERAIRAREEEAEAHRTAAAAAAAELTAREEAEAAATRAGVEAETRKQAERAAAALAAREAAAAAERARAEAESAAAEQALLEEHAARMIQANVRSYLQRIVYFKAWKSVVTLQKLHRGRVVKSLAQQLLTAANLLKSGNIFLKFSKDGPPHDRLVWITADMSALLWCNPNKNRTHDLKPEARLDIREISAITEGIKTELFKNAVKINEGGITRMSLINSLKREDSQVLKKREEISDLCCFSIIANSRTVDLVAPSNRVRDDWLRALRMLLVHMNLTSTLRDVANQKRILGDLQTSSGSVWAADILTHRYEAVTVDVYRGKMGLGLLIDSATNRIIEIDDVGSAVLSRLLKVGDVVTTVDGHVVTSIVDGMLQPRSAVTSAIDPTKQQLKVTVFRPI